MAHRVGRGFGGAHQGQSGVALDRNAFSELKASAHRRRYRGLQAERLRHRSEGRASARGSVGGCVPARKRWAGGGVGADLDRELRHWTRFHQRGAHRIAHEIMHHALLAKTHFGLRWVHIDVHFAAGQVEKQQHHRENRGRQNVAVGLDDGVLDQPVADQASIHEDVNRIAVQFLDFGFGDEAVDVEFAEVWGFWSGFFASITGFFFGCRPLAGGGARATLGCGRPMRSRGCTAAMGISWSRTSLPKTWYTRSLYPATGGATSMALVAECSSKCLSGWASA